MFQQQSNLSKSHLLNLMSANQLSNTSRTSGMSPNHNTHPAHQEEIIVNMSIDHPGWGSGTLSYHLQKAGYDVSPAEIQKILDQHELGSREARWMLLKMMSWMDEIELTDEQIAFIENCNQEQYDVPQAPGEILYADSFPIGILETGLEVTLHAVVDAYSSFAFGYLSSDPTGGHILKGQVLRFFRDHGLIGHFHDGHNSIFERFKYLVLDEFASEAFQEGRYHIIESVMLDLEDWLEFYNYIRPFHNGPSPYTRIVWYLEGFDVLQPLPE